MKFRSEYIGKQASLSQAGTYQQKLSFSNPITALDILVENTNGSTSNTGVRIADEVSAIEVADGSHHVFSLPMKEAMASSYYRTKAPPYTVLTEAADGVQYEGFRLLFGRWFGDPEYYLKPANYNNLVFSLTNSFTEHASTGWADDAGKLTLRAHTMLSGVSGYKGVIMTKSHYNITSVGSGELTIDLPTDFPYLAIMLIARLTTKRPEQIISNVKLMADNGAYVPFDTRTLDLIIDDYPRRHPYKLEQLVKEADDASFTTIPFRSVKGINIGVVDDFIVTIEAVTADSVQIGTYDLTTPATPALGAAGDFKFMIEGYCPHGSIYIPFGDEHKAEVLAINEYKDWKLKLTQILAAAQLRCIIDQIAPR